MEVQNVTLEVLSELTRDATSQEIRWREGPSFIEQLQEMERASGVRTPAPPPGE